MMKCYVWMDGGPADNQVLGVDPFGPYLIYTTIDEQHLWIDEIYNWDHLEVVNVADDETILLGVAVYAGRVR